MVFGGSWGSTLALAYAERPSRTLPRPRPARHLSLPAQRDRLVPLRHPPRLSRGLAQLSSRSIPEAERGDLLAAYYRRLTDPDPAVHLPAARSWSVYEGACSTLLPSPDTVAAFGEDRMALGLARIEAHYFRHDDLRAGTRPARAHRPHPGIPATIVQGRYDMVCPIVTADELARAWPEAEYAVVPDAGHSAMEPGIRAQLVAATERAKRLA